MPATSTLNANVKSVFADAAAAADFFFELIAAGRIARIEIVDGLYGRSFHVAVQA